MLSLMAKPGNPQVAIGYLRVSTEDQSLGIDAQRTAIEAWALRAGVTVVEWFTDQGVSGSTALADRPGFVAALGAVKTNKAGVFVIAKRDRLARDVQISLMAEGALKEVGASLISADGVANGDSPADKFMRTVVNGASEYELGMIRLRTKAALAAKKAQGRRVGEIPFGYRLASGSDSVLEEHDGEQAVIAEVRRLRGEGRSLRSIVRQLEGMRTYSRAGTPFGVTQVQRMTRVM